MMLNDITAYLGQDKKYLKEFLKIKLKLKSKQKE